MLIHLIHLFTDVSEIEDFKGRILL